MTEKRKKKHIRQIPSLTDESTKEGEKGGKALDLL